MTYLALMQAVDDDDGINIDGSELGIILLVLLVVLCIVLIVYYARRM